MFSRTSNRAALPSRRGGYSSEDRYLRSELSKLLRFNLLGGSGSLLRALLLRDIGALRLQGESSKRGRSSVTKARAGSSSVFSSSVSSNTFPAMRLRRLALPRELDLSTCVSDGFLDLLAHDAAQPVVDHGGRITPNTRRQGLAKLMVVVSR